MLPEVCCSSGTALGTDSHSIVQIIAYARVVGAHTAAVGDGEAEWLQLLDAGLGDDVAVVKDAHVVSGEMARHRTKALVADAANMRQIADCSALGLLSHVALHKQGREVRSRPQPQELLDHTSPQHHLRGTMSVARSKNLGKQSWSRGLVLEEVKRRARSVADDAFEV